MRQALPPGWVWSTLGEIASWSSGGTPKATEPRYYGGEIPWLVIGDLNDSIVTRSGKTITPLGHASSSAKFVEPGALLVALYGSIGKLGIAGIRCTTNQAIAFTTNISTTVHPRFLFYYLKHARARLIALGKGGTQANISQSVLKTFPIGIPPITEQRRIVEMLEELLKRADECDQRLAGVPRILETFHRAVLGAACAGRFTKLWRQGTASEPLEQTLSRVRLAQSSTGRGATDSVIPGRYVLSVGHPNHHEPEGWKWVPLLRVARLESGHTPSRRHPEYWEGSIPWIGIRDAREHHGDRIYNTRQHVNELGLANSAARLLPAGTVCLSRTASVGYVVIMGEPMATSQDFVNWVCSEALLPDFLMYAILAEGDDITKFGRGTTHTTIYFPEVKALHICLPPVSEQTEIVKRIQALLKLNQHAERSVATIAARTSRLKHAIFAEAFSGRFWSPPDCG